MPRRRQALTPAPPWPAATELVGLELTLKPTEASTIPAYHPRLIHAWFLDQIRQFDPQLSNYLHDSGGDKPFGLSGLKGPLLPKGKRFQLDPNSTYTWTVTALSAEVAQGLATWLTRLPTQMELQQSILQVQTWSIALPATTYAQLWATSKPTPTEKHLSLSFLSPTSFRQRGHHLPLPVPKNIFESYLRRWNLFADQPISVPEFLDWVEEHVEIVQHQLVSSQTQTTTAAKATIVGFTGAVEFRLVGKLTAEYQQLFWVLGQLAPYVGTGYRTPYGLGQTCLGWQIPMAEMPVSSDSPSTVHVAALPTEAAVLPVRSSRRQLTARIKELTALFKAQRKRQGGSRAEDAAKLWATIVARRETGENVRLIALDLDLPFESVKTYLKLARRAMQVGD